MSSIVSDVSNVNVEECPVCCDEFESNSDQWKVVHNTAAKVHKMCNDCFQASLTAKKLGCPLCREQETELKKAHEADPVNRANNRVISRQRDSERERDITAMLAHHPSIADVRRALVMARTLEDRNLRDQRVRLIRIRLNSASASQCVIS